MKKYNVSNISQLEYVKAKKIETCRENFGVDYPMQNKKIKEKIKNTNLERYGVEFSSQNSEIYEKIRNTTIKNNNGKIGFANEKFKETLLEKYGVENIMQNEKIKNKLRKILEEKGIWRNEADITKFQKYSNSIKALTKKNKKELFENWNGLDYYDNEKIDVFLIEHYNHPNYPTIDHKTSIYNGYLENLSIEYMSSLNNLCITKRRINCSEKRKYNDVQFLDNKLC